MMSMNWSMCDIVLKDIFNNISKVNTLSKFMTCKLGVCKQSYYVYVVYYRRQGLFT